MYFNCSFVLFRQQCYNNSFTFDMPDVAQLTWTNRGSPLQISTSSSSVRSVSINLTFTRLK